MPFVSSVQLLPLYICQSHFCMQLLLFHATDRVRGGHSPAHTKVETIVEIENKPKQQQLLHNYISCCFPFFLDLFFPSLFSFLILYFSLVYICTIITNHNQLPIILQFIIVVKCVFWPFRLLSSCALVLASSSFVHLCADDTLWQSLRKNVFFLHDVCYVMFIFSFYFTLSPECLFSCCTFN